MAKRNRFPDGLVLESHKREALAGPILDVPAPERLFVALDQGSGSLVIPTVRVGDEILRGAVIARPQDERATVLHAPVSGRVLEIRELPADEMGPCIVLENDRADRADPGLSAIDDFVALTPDVLVARLRESGIAGLGGAAFPTATKLRAARQRTTRQLVLNGAECEPWICCDDALMRTHAEDVVLGLRVLAHALEAEAVFLVVEDDKVEAVAALQAALERHPVPVATLEVLPAIFPQGAEKQLITDLTGVEVPSEGVPADAGFTCQNVGTAAAVARWVRTGEPCMDRVVTVTGHGVAHPCNVRARLGTPLAALIDAAGGYVKDPLRLVIGGSMTGRALSSDAVGVTKATNCVFVATHGDLATKLVASEQPCIRCGDCATVCPAGLLPQELHRYARAQDAPALHRYGLWDCIDCGCCDYVCPSQIPLAQQFRVARHALRDHEISADRAALARERYLRKGERMRQAAPSEREAFDSARARARAAAGSEPSDSPHG
jgi:electron transport complex protein RnfC